VEISTNSIDCEIHVEESCFAIADHGVPVESSTETVDQGIYVENFIEIEQTREQNEFGKEEKIREEWGVEEILGDGVGVYALVERNYKVDMMKRTKMLDV
jgi:hypothetical protein